MKKRLKLRKTWNSQIAPFFTRTGRLVVLLLLLSTQVWAGRSYSQKKILNLNLKKSSLIDVFAAIEKQSDFYFLYNYEQVKQEEDVSARFSNMTITDILERLLKKTSLKYEVINKQVIISPKKGFKESKMLSVQSRIIKGKVFDTEGNPIVGATITIKGTTLGTTTDANGMYQLKTDANAQTLIFSFIGMKTKEVKMNEVGDVVVLETDNIGLDEVMVVAYGSAKRSSYTGSATVVDKKELEKMQRSNITQTLQGMSSGVQVINNDGSPGADAAVMIRGIGSMYASSSPLYVVDGVPFAGYLNSINSSDIESVTILKDAAATSLYGSRAANGVIVITTKKGKTEQGQFHAKMKFSFSDLAVDLPEKLNPKEYYEVTWLALKNGKMDDGMSAAEAAQWATDNVVSEIKINPFNSSTPVGIDGKVGNEVKQLFCGDWQGELIKPRAKQEYLIDFSGKKGTTQYYLSGSYLNDKGIFTIQKFKRFSLRGNVSSKVKKWLEIGTNTAMSLANQKSPDTSIRFIRTVPSVYPVYEWNYENNEYKKDSNGNRIYDYGNNRTEWIGWNPLADAAYNKTESLYDNLSSRSFIEVTFSPSLKWRTNLSIDYNSLRYGYYASSLYGFAAEKGGEASKSSGRTMALTLNNLLTYDKEFKLHHVNILLGQEAYKWRYDYLYGEKEGFPFSGLYELRSAATMTGIDSYIDNYRLLSFFGKVDYDYADRYYLTLSYRSDGSSRFSHESRWGEFWSVGASWRLSKESFLADIDWINNLKLKASYGAVGNDKISSMYAYQGLYATGMDDYNNAGVLVSRLATPDLKWESNLQLNVGLEYQLMNKLSGSFEYFNRKSKDLLFTVPMAPSTGFSGIDKNIGDVKNTGYEIELNYIPCSSSNFSWNIKFNLSHYKNTITRMPQKEMLSGYFKWEEGKSRYSFWGAEYAGVNPETGNDQWWKNVFQTNDAGNLVYDENGNKIISERIKTENYSDVNGDDQKKYLGDATPKVFGSLTNSFKIHHFDLSFMVYYSIGGKLYDGDYSQMMAYRSGMSYHKDVLKGWSPENMDSDVPRFSTKYENSLGAYSSKFLYNNTFFRLRNVSLGYNIPSSLLKKVKIQELHLFLSGDNLLTFGKSQKRGTDPEQSIGGTTDNRFGALKTVSFGFDITL